MHSNKTFNIMNLININIERGIQMNDTKNLESEDWGYSLENETWESLKKKGTAEIVSHMNLWLQFGNTMESIMENLGAGSRTASRYLAKRGYRYNGREYVLKDQEQKEKQQIIEPETKKKIVPDTKKQSEPKEPTVKTQPVSTTDISLQVYADVHNTLRQLNITDYVRTSLSYAKETQGRLDQFLKDKPLLKKQDFITHAIEDAINKYDSK